MGAPRTGIRFVGTLVVTVIAGCGARTGLELPPIAIAPGDNAYLCGCTCSAGPVSRTRTIVACVPPALNPNLPGGTTPTPAALQADCSGRVAPTLTAAAQFALGLCGVGGCTCNAFGPTQFSAACDAACPTVPLVAGGGNFKAATVVPAGACGAPAPVPAVPLCRVPGSDPPTPTPDGFWRDVLGTHTAGVVTSGTAVVTIGADTPRVTPVHGDVEFSGHPCPGQSCAQGFSFSLTADNFEVGSVLGFVFTVSIEGVQMGGAGTPGVLVVDESGVGVYPAGTIQAWGRGSAVERFLGLETRRTTGAFLFANTGPVTVTIDWPGRRFMVEDEFAIPAGEDPVADPAVSVRVNFEGVLQNLPPRAAIDAPSSIECASSGGGIPVVLDGTGSTDPDGDTLVYAWRAGSDLALPLLGSDPSVTVDQDPGTTVEYSLRVWDDDFQMSEAIAQVEIVDTQPPSLEVLDVATDCLWAPDHSMHLFRLGDEIVAQASDACDGAVSVRIVDVQSNQPRNATGDGSTEPDVVFGDQAFCIRSERQGVAAAGRTYTVVLEAHDAVGNASTQEILIDVPRDQRPASRCLTGGLVPAVEDDDPRCTESLPVAASTDLPAGAVPEIPRVPPAGCAIGRGRTSPLVAVSVLVVAVLMRQRSRRRHAR